MAAAIGSILGDVLGFFFKTAEVAVTKGPAAAGRRLLSKRLLIASVWPGMRTVGFLGEYLEPRFVAALGPLGEHARRLLAAQRLFSVTPFPGFGSFRRGVAYRDVFDVAEGWLAFFPEMLVAGTQANELTVGMFEALTRGDWVESLDILADTLTEAKLEDPVAFLRGLIQMGTDIETVAGAAGAMTAATAILGDALTGINDGSIVNIADLLRFLGDFSRRPDEPPRKPDLPGARGETDEEFEERLRDRLEDVLQDDDVAGPAGRRVIREFRVSTESMRNSERLVRKIVGIVGGRGN